MPGAAALAVATLFAFGQGRAQAGDPPRVDLTWTADPSCPRGDAVVAEVERLARGAPPRELLVARAEVEHDVSWRVRLETRSGGSVGKRQIEAESCAQLADATALILALMIDPAAGSDPRPPDSPQAPPVFEREKAAPPAPAFAPPAPSPSRPSPRSVLGAVTVSALGDVGTLPGAAPGLGLSAGLLVSSYRVMGNLAYFPSQTASLAARPSAGGDFTLAGGALVACRTLLTLGPARGALCAGAELDALLAKGFGVRSPRDGSTRWGAFLFGALVDLDIASPVSAELRIGGAVPFGRPPFSFDDLGTVYRPAAVALRLALGLSAHF
jgi:hypothetical protein